MPLLRRYRTVTVGAMLEFRILGPLEVVAEDGPVPLGGPRQRATLAILLLNSNRVVSVERLADNLYAGAAPVTAVTQVQRQVSELRRALGSASAIETRSPGYVLRVSPAQVDLSRFERLTAEATSAVARADPAGAVHLLRDALDLWRGGALADLAFEPFAQRAIERLEEMRLTARELRIDAELMLGRHSDLVGELEALVAEHPLRERLRGQLMLSLYRSGRQAEALGVYRKARAELVLEFGLEPSNSLRELQRGILTQDPSLDLERAGAARTGHLAESEPAVLALLPDQDRPNGLLAIAEPLASLPQRELILVRLVENESELQRATSHVKACTASIKVRTRAAAFTTGDRAGDAVRLASTHDVELVLLDAPARLDADRLPDELAEILERSPADVAVLAGSFDVGRGKAVCVPFGGGEHDWAALEVGAWLSLASSISLILVGTRADSRGRDASRLLADASLTVQRVVGVETEPVLANPSTEGLLKAVEPAAIVVVGISERWRKQGIGDSRRVLVRHGRPPILLVHRGLRPGGLAPRETRTRFTWTVAV
jgi:DNA-binding SARP family transcriptional activator